MRLWHFRRYRSAIRSDAVVAVLVSILLAGCAGQRTAMGPDAVLAVGKNRVAIEPVGGCQTAIIHPRTASNCSSSGEDYSAAAEHPTMLGADRRFAFKVKNSDVDLVQVSLLAKNQAGTFEPKFTHTSSGRDADEDLRDLTPGVYIIEVFTRISGQSNALYRFALEIP